MIEAYWNEVFGQFKGHDGKFNIPGFPEPLMSTHFGVKNIIGPTSVEIKQTFRLCVLEPLSIPNNGKKKSNYQTLNEAISSLQYWEYQKQNNETYGFIQKLLPFLNSLPQPHYHFYLKDDEGITASALVGVAECSCFIFNLSVLPKMRNQGLASILLSEIRSTFYEKRAFYWTIHPWFTFDSVAQDYHLLK